MTLTDRDRQTNGPKDNEDIRQADQQTDTRGKIHKLQDREDPEKLKKGRNRMTKLTPREMIGPSNIVKQKKNWMTKSKDC